MKKIFGLLITLFLLSGCVESMALLGPASTSVAGGNIIQSSFSSAMSYGVKKQTGKSPIEHLIEHAEQKKPNKTKGHCQSFVEKTNSEICTIVKKQLELTKSKILMRSKEKSIKDLTSSLKANINKKSKIKYLD